MDNPYTQRGHLHAIDERFQAVSYTTVTNLKGQYFSVHEPKSIEHALRLRGVTKNAAGEPDPVELEQTLRDMGNSFTAIQPIMRTDGTWLVTNTNPFADERLPLGGKAFASVTDALDAAQHWYEQDPANREVVCSLVAKRAFDAEQTLAQERDTQVQPASTSAVFEHDDPTMHFAGHASGWDVYVAGDDLVLRFGNSPEQFKSINATEMIERGLLERANPPYAEALRLAVESGHMEPDGAAREPAQPVVNQRESAFGLSR